MGRRLGMTALVLKRNSQCISVYYLVTVATYLKKINLRTNGFISVYGFRMLRSIMARKAWWPKREATL